MALPQSPTKFVRLYMRDKPMREIAEEYGVILATVHQWKAALIEAGVELPKRSVSRSRTVSVGRLNRLIRELQQG